VLFRSLGPDAPRRRVVAALPAGYRAPAVAPFLDLVHAEVAALDPARLETSVPVPA